MEILLAYAMVPINLGTSVILSILVRYLRNRRLRAADYFYKISRFFILLMLIDIIVIIAKATFGFEFSNIFAKVLMVFFVPPSIVIIVTYNEVDNPSFTDIFFDIIGMAFVVSVLTVILVVNVFVGIEL